MRVKRYKFQVPTEIKIIDNFLDPMEFNALVNALLRSEKPMWALGTNITGLPDNPDDNHVYFAHSIQVPIKELIPVLQALNVSGFGDAYRIKVNLYPRTSEVYHHSDHVDADFPHKGAILYLNTNNGFTVVDGTPVESVENRLLLFDPSIPHHSTTCSDQPFRANINFNFKS